jgi:hypothetical protein
VVAVGVPADAADRFVSTLPGGQRRQIPLMPAGFVTTAEQPLSVGSTLHVGGRPMVLAFADPEAFAARFGQPFNASLAGEVLLATVLLNPDCAGVLINSALAEVSVVIDRATAESLALPASERPADKSIGHKLAEALTHLGGLLSVAGRVADAQQAYRRSVEIREALWSANPEDIEIKAGCAGSLCNVGRWVDAERLVDEVVALVPGHPYANQLKRYIAANRSSGGVASAARRPHWWRRRFGRT